MLNTTNSFSYENFLKYYLKYSSSEQSLNPHKSSFEQLNKNSLVVLITLITFQWIIYQNFHDALNKTYIKKLFMIISWNVYFKYSQISNLILWNDISNHLVTEN